MDRKAVINAVHNCSPDVIVHELSAIPKKFDLRKFEQAFAATNTLRTEGTDTLLAAAAECNVRHFVAQSFAGWPYARTGSLVKAEDSPLDPDPPHAMRATLAAIEHLESAVTNAGSCRGVVLRYGSLYGPDTYISASGPMVQLLRKRRVPIVGAGTGVWSFLHIDDAASATLAAIESDVAGVFNTVDSEPAPVREWLPELARDVGAPRPMRVPRWLGRLAIGQHGVLMMNDIRGASNEKIKSTLNWTPKWQSWRYGFRNGL